MIRKKFDNQFAVAILKTVPLFASLGDPELSLLLERSSTYDYGKDEIIIMSGEESKEMYVVLKGQVKVVKITPDGEERVMAFRHSGDYFGDMGLLDSKTDSATVIATDHCKVLLISKQVFDEFFLDDKKAMLQVIEMLCGRLGRAGCLISFWDPTMQSRRSGQLWPITAEPWVCRILPA